MARHDDRQAHDPGASARPGVEGAGLVAPGGDHGHDDGHHQGHGHGHDHASRGGLLGALQLVFAPHSPDNVGSVEAALQSRGKEIRAVKAGGQVIDGVRVRCIGQRLEASLHAAVDCEGGVLEGHAIADHVRHELLHGVRGLDDVRVHVDPCGPAGTDPRAVATHHRVAPAVRPALPESGSP